LIDWLVGCLSVIEVFRFGGVVEEVPTVVSGRGGGVAVQLAVPALLSSFPDSCGSRCSSGVVDVAEEPSTGNLTNNAEIANKFVVHLSPLQHHSWSSSRRPLGRSLTTDTVWCQFAAS